MAHIYTPFLLPAYVKCQRPASSTSLKFYLLYCTFFGTQAKDLSTQTLADVWTSSTRIVSHPRQWGFRERNLRQTQTHISIIADARELLLFPQVRHFFNVEFKVLKEKKKEKGAINLAISGPTSRPLHSDKQPWNLQERKIRHREECRAQYLSSYHARFKGGQA